MVDGRVEELRNEPPLTIKCIQRAYELELLLVGSAASFLEGDDLTIEITVSGSMPVVVRSVAAQVAHPCPNGGSTAQTVALRSFDGGRLLWSVEPLIVAGGAAHTNSFSVSVDESSRAVVLDTVVLGRSSEDPRTALLCAHMSARHGEALVLDDGLDTSLRGAHGPAGLSGNRVLSNVLAVGWTPAIEPGTLPLAAGGALHRSLSADACSAGPSVTDATKRWWSEAVH